MKIILSRKGFDSGAGGTSSPILEDGTIVSMPIPDGSSTTRYGNVVRHGINLGTLANDLTRGKVHSGHRCHLDPDLDQDSIARLPGWRPTFGQTGAAQTHLAGEGVERGDLFLFFGWFREAERLAHGNGRHVWKRGARHRHVIFGWMQIDEIVPVHGRETEILTKSLWLRDHPHLNRPGDRLNHLYIGSRKLSLPGLPDLRFANRKSIPGAGSFRRFFEDLSLTAPATKNRSAWSLPSFFHPDTAGTRLSYHDDPQRWAIEDNRALLQSAARGQEFVYRHPEGRYLPVRDWLETLFSQAVC